MASRTISLHEDAYRRLREAKQPGESFSDVVNRLTGRPKGDWRKLVGILSKEQGDAMMRQLRESRAAARADALADLERPWSE